jgi:serine/threonine protein kinase
VLTPGSVIDERYEIIAPLAEGGMGAVYRARRRLLGDEVAIKVVLHDATELSARDRFLRESRIAASLRHPSIVSIFDFDMPPGGEPYLVMELLSGPSLREEIDARGRLDVEDVQRILPGICAALELAHANGVVHRDLKPANIVAHEYEPGGRTYKLVDFGVANLRETTVETRLTAAHEFVGTVAYAAPEQVSTREVDARADVYALAAIVFEMVTGQRPFPGRDLLAIIAAQMSGEVPRPSALRPDLPPWLDEAVMKGLAPNVADRWTTASEFGAALSASAEPAPGGTAPSTNALHAMYEVGERLGPGRLGSSVYRGVHRALGHPVAIRILTDDAHPNWPAARERFLREARALQVPHASIIQVRDYGEAPGLVYLVTDLIEGPSLRTALADGPLPWTRLAPLLTQLFDAVRQLHRRQALICGLSPEIMRIRPLRPATASNADPDVDDVEAERLLISTAAIWSAKDLLATLHDATLRGIAIEDVELRYVAPELLTGGAVDVRSDVFTIGVLAYEMATGRLPYDGTSMPELLGRMLAGTPQDPRAVVADLPEAFSSALLRALAAAPAGRFASVKAFERATDQVS